jgi:hypothetical protein
MPQQAAAAGPGAILDVDEDARLDPLRLRLGRSNSFGVADAQRLDAGEQGLLSSSLQPLSIFFGIHQPAATLLAQIK